MTLRRFTPRRLGKAALAAALLSVTLVGAPAVATAGHGHGRGPKGHHVYRGPKHWAPPHAVVQRIVVPQVIHQPLVTTYEPYYYGRVYHPVRRHYVQVYAFPVLTNGVYVYTPFAYADGRLLERGYFTATGPRFSFAIGF